MKTNRIIFAALLLFSMTSIFTLYNVRNKFLTEKYSAFYKMLHHETDSKLDKIEFSKPSGKTFILTDPTSLNYLQKSFELDDAPQNTLDMVARRTYFYFDDGSKEIATLSIEENCNSMIILFPLDRYSDAYPYSRGMNRPIPVELKNFLTNFLSVE